jgi:hypothetical protein
MHMMARRAGGSLKNLILERDAFGIVFLEPFFRGVDVREHLDMVSIAYKPWRACGRRGRPGFGLP